MREPTVSLKPPSAPVSAEDRHAATLTGNMSVSSLMLTVLAFSAPIAAVAGFIPFTIMFGGPGAALIFVLVTASVLMFAVGYVTMTRWLPKPGSFYAFISAGLGKVPGLGAAFLAVSAYLLMLSGVFVFIGLTVTELISSVNGPSTPWWPWAAIAWVIVSSLCYFHIELSAKILSVAMVLEVAIVMVFNIGVLVHGGGPEGFSARPFSPSALADGDFGVAFLFAVMIFIGFEATALFRDEVRDPDRTIPRATYGAVLFVGVLYIVSCYLLVTAYGSDAVQVATEDPKGMFSNAIGSLVAPMFSQLTFVFILTSELAAGIAVHNVVSRYIYNLGVDRALPAFVAEVHPKHHSPARASTVVAVAVAVLLVPLGLGKPDGVGLDAQLFGLATVGVLTLMCLVSLAVIVWFARKGVRAVTNWFKCFVAPAVAMAVLVPTLALAVLHFDLVVGGAPGQNVGLLLILAASAVIGAMLALYFRAYRPEIFAALGRADTGEADV
ncbi:APC family permease [Mycolicibacterium porcinum]|uniref:APC family permease n=1 Tax=Mycolicibacterium porcinum TaxID=39693 RepID=A0AAW5TG20_9MYCO|nr:APC family permease [Mycolicibacterium porcinum]MCV7392962.1 APC family permease [Mycolicibacterium porcinum]ORB33628.1 permease [Mycolicibacterium porcinum]CDO31008.1 putative amino acid permease [Mycolicibacterium vulneris]